MADLHHLLACAPINQTRRSDVVIDFQRQCFAAALLAVDNNAAELHIGRLRVVVHLQCGQLPAAAVVVGADSLMVGHVAQPRFLHHNKGAVVKHLPMLCGSYCRTANKHKGKKGSSHLSD